MVPKFRDRDSGLGARGSGLGTISLVLGLSHRFFREARVQSRARCRLVFLRMVEVEIGHVIAGARQWARRRRFLSAYPAPKRPANPFVGTSGLPSGPTPSPPLLHMEPLRQKGIAL